MALSGFLAGAGLLVGGTALDVLNAGRVLPAVRFESLPLGGLTHGEVRGVFDTHLNAFQAAPYVFFLGEREWRPAAPEMGLQLDLDAMAQDAVDQGRTYVWPLRAFTGLATYFTHPTVPLRAALNRAQLGAFLSAVAIEVDREPVNAAISIRNGQIVAGQSAQGRRVDIAATLERVPLPQTLMPQRVDVAIAASLPALSEATIQEAQATATRILSGPLTLRLGDATWTLTPAQLGAMIEFNRTQAGTGDLLTASLAEPKVIAYVRTLATEIDKPAASAQLRWNGSAAAIVKESADGVRLDQAAAVKAIINQAPTDARQIALVTAISKPAITSDPATVGSIKQLVATGTSKFTGSSPERVNNIQVAARKLDGLVIPPGTTFSFLRALGPITTANGYQEGLTIQGDATVPGVGGGVCQVSTTVFRAAFFAGLPIVERHQHTYRVSYYEQDGSPVGFDAAVYDPGVDLRFKNDTEHAMLLHSQVDTKAATIAFRIYSTSSGRDVSLTPVKSNEIKAGPRLPDFLDPALPKGQRKQMEWSADGADATIRRLVNAGGKTVLSDAFFSRYVPWREKWAIGAG